MEVAGPGLEGWQVAVLRLDVAVSWPRNKDIVFLNEEMYMVLVALFLWSQRTPSLMVLEDTSSLPRLWVNRASTRS